MESLYEQGISLSAEEIVSESRGFSRLSLQFIRLETRYSELMEEWYLELLEEWYLQGHNKSCPYRRNQDSRRSSSSRLIPGWRAMLTP